jgi:hypothetical protein
MHPGRETSMHYFSFSGGLGAVTAKSVSRHLTLSLCFLHTVGSMGHAVHSGVSKAQHVDALFFMLGWDCTDSTQSFPGQVTLNLCFCVPWDLRVTQCILVSPGRETSMHYLHSQVGPVQFP